MQFHLRSSVAINLIVGLTHLAIVSWLAHRRALLPRNLSALDFRNFLADLESEKNDKIWRHSLASH